MQLGGHVSSTLSHAAEWAAEAEVEAPNPWGNDDLMDINADQDDWSEIVICLPGGLQTLRYDPGAFETAPVLGYEAYDKEPAKVPVDSECPCSWNWPTNHNEIATATPRRAVTPLKQPAPSRSPTATPPAPQQATTVTPQPSIANMTKEEKAAEMNRRKEERKQVSGVGDFVLSRRSMKHPQRIAQLKAQKASNGKE